VFLWYGFGAIFGVWNVFQSPGLDFRLIAAGALVPELIDLPFGAQAYAHTLLAAIVVLTATMLATTGRGRRLLRRRALGLAIGWFAALVLSAAWTHKEVFWWPAFGASRPDAGLFPVWPVVVVEELLGLAAAWWTWNRFGLRDPQRRRAFVHGGRLAIVGPGAPGNGAMGEDG
jgi:hypothetical protein